MVHGGSWRNGDKGELTNLAHELAAAGYTVADVRYRLAPFPAGVLDVKRLVAAFRARAAELRLDPRRVALLGRSAGGQIALVAGYTAGAPALVSGLPEEPVQAVVALYAPADLEWGHANPARPDIVRGTESLEVYLGGPPSTAPETWRLGSPLAWTATAAPTLLLHGDDDGIVGLEHSRRLDAALRAAGRDVRFVTVPFGTHGMDARPGSVSAQVVRHEVVDFLARTI